MRIKISPFVNDATLNVQPDLIEALHAFNQTGIFEEANEKSHAITMAYCSTRHLGCRSTGNISALVEFYETDPAHMFVEEVVQSALTRYCTPKGISAFKNVLFEAIPSNIDDSGTFASIIQKICKKNNGLLKKYNINPEPNYECISAVTPYGIILYSQFLAHIAYEMKEKKKPKFDDLSKLVQIIPFGSPSSHDKIKAAKNLNATLNIIFKQSFFQDLFSPQPFSF